MFALSFGNILLDASQLSQPEDVKRSRAVDIASVDVYGKSFGSSSSFNPPFPITWRLIVFLV
jgi:hypothetical protein